jgi:hypothetical protein
MNIEQEIQKINERNKRVELDKAWETSWTRKFIVAFLTYAVVVSFFVFAQLPDPFVNSIVPALAFIISNLALPMFKKLWLKFR